MITDLMTDVRYDVHMILLDQQVQVVDSFDLPIWRLNDSLFHDNRLFIFEHDRGTWEGRPCVYMRHSTVYMKETLLNGLRVPKDDV